MTPEEYKANKEYSPTMEEGQTADDSGSGDFNYDDVFSQIPLADSGADPAASSDPMANLPMGAPAAAPADPMAGVPTDPMAGVPTDPMAGIGMGGMGANPYAPTSPVDVGMGIPGMGMGMNQPAQQAPVSNKDKLKSAMAETMLQAGNAGLTALKDPTKLSSPEFLNKYAHWLIGSAAAMGILGVIQFVISLFTPYFTQTPAWFLGGLLSFAVGYGMTIFVPKADEAAPEAAPAAPAADDYYNGFDPNVSLDTPSNEDLFPGLNDTPAAAPADDAPADDAGFAGDEDAGFAEDGDSDDNAGFAGEDDAEGSEDAESDDSSEDDPNDAPIDWGALVVPDAPAEIQPGTQTRSYLFEAMQKILPKLDKNFGDVTVITEDDEGWNNWGYSVAQAAEMQGLDPEVVTLNSLSETEQVIKLRINRQSGTSSKEDKLVDEILNSYKVDEDTGNIIHPDATAFHTANGGSLYMTIVKGTSPMVGIGDVMDKCKDYLLDTHNSRPWLMGISKEGEVYKTDVSDINSIIMAGLPRSGKSWAIELMLFNICWFSSPKETNIHIWDVKSGASSYQNFKLPHVKKLLTNIDDIREDIHWIFDVEEQRRQDIFREHHVSKIQDLYKDDPSMAEEVPYLYIVVEEMIGLKDKMDKDEQTEWKSRQAALVTMLPAYGIFPIFVPHRIVDSVISKTTSSNIPARLAFKMDMDNLTESMGVKRNDFPYTLSNMGDAAAKIDGMEGSTAFFLHALVITDSTFNNTKVYEYLSDIWHKLCPDSYGFWEEDATSTVTMPKAIPTVDTTPRVATSAPTVPISKPTHLPSLPSSPSTHSAPKSAPSHWAPVDKTKGSGETLPEDFWDKLIDSGNE